MANINLGPAITSTPSQTATLASANTPNFGNLGNGQNTLRILAIARAVPLTNTGDAAVVPIINSGTWVASTVVICNAVGGTAATANLTINTGAAVTGTSVRAAGVLTGVTGPTTALAAAAASVAVVSPAQSLFINVSVAAAGVTVDIFVYGYDVT